MGYAAASDGTGEGAVGHSKPAERGRAGTRDGGADAAIPPDHGGASGGREPAGRGEAGRLEGEEARRLGFAGDCAGARGGSGRASPAEPRGGRARAGAGRSGAGIFLPRADGSVDLKDGPDRKSVV